MRLRVPRLCQVRPDPLPASKCAHSHAPVGRAQLLQREQVLPDAQLQFGHVLGHLQLARLAQGAHLRVHMKGTAWSALWTHI